MIIMIMIIRATYPKRSVQHEIACTPLRRTGFVNTGDSPILI